MTNKQPQPRYKGIKIAIDDEFWDRFQKIKQELGLTSDSEVVRFVITQFYRREFGEKCNNE